MDTRPCWPSHSHEAGRAGHTLRRDLSWRVKGSYESKRPGTRRPAPFTSLRGSVQAQLWVPAAV